MRFVQTACKFEGLHFSHHFFYDLMYLLVAMSVNVAEKEKKMWERSGDPSLQNYILKLYKSLPQQMAALI